MSFTNITLGVLPADNYAVTVFNYGNENFSGSYYSSNFSIFKYPSQVKIDDISNGIIFK